MNLILLTSNFPYLPGEQFIESEISYLGRSSFDEITILPSSAAGDPRPYPSNIKIDKALTHKKATLRYVLKAPFNKIFINEILFLKKIKKLRLKTAIQALRSVAQVIRYYENLEKWIEKNGKCDVVYTYWNDTASYAACLAKQKGLVRKVVSRAHGFDVYEERRPNNYMPLKRQFNNDFEKIYLLSSEAKYYFSSNYGFNEKKLEIAPLGVQVPYSKCSSTEDNKLNILSVSFCVPVKRIDKIIQSIFELASDKPNLSITWTHIGDGPLKKNLLEMASHTFEKMGNVTFFFKGNLENKEVVNFYNSQPVDCIINTSESEGIPVSIMEAMATGVPAIAPNVGGISDLVDKENGWLLSKNPTVQEIKNALDVMQHKAKTPEVRAQARKRITESFNADINYQIFIKKIQQI